MGLEPRGRQVLERSRSLETRIESWLICTNINLSYSLTVALPEHSGLWPGYKALPLLLTECPAPQTLSYLRRVCWFSVHLSVVLRGGKWAGGGAAPHYQLVLRFLVSLGQPNVCSLIRPTVLTAHLILKHLIIILRGLVSTSWHTFIISLSALNLDCLPTSD